MTADLHTHQPRRLRSTAEIASLSASEPMSNIERAEWLTANYGGLLQHLHPDLAASDLAAVRNEFRRQARTPRWTGYDEPDEDQS